MRVRLEIEGFTVLDLILFEVTEVADPKPVVLFVTPKTAEDDEDAPPGFGG